MTVHMGVTPGNVNFYILGQAAQVKLGTTFYPYGTNWQYILGNTVTQITVGSNHDVFLSFNSTTGSINVTSFTVTGYVLGGQGKFNEPSITLASPTNANVTALALFDSSGLVDFATFTVPIPLTAGSTTTITHNFTDTRTLTGIVNYVEAAYIQSGSNFQVVNSNTVSLNYGNFTIGNLNINFTNPVQVPIWFHRTDVSSSLTRISVIFPATGNLTCNLAYKFAQTNSSYFNIPFVVYDATQHNSSFLFTNSTKDIITILCEDLNTKQTGQYILTQTVFPFIQQIIDFRNGTFGTHGQFGMLDIVTLSVVIFSMIGFNRINESVGAFFSIAIVGVAAYWGILTFPGVMAAAVAIVAVLAITSTRKTGGF